MEAAWPSSGFLGFSFGSRSPASRGKREIPCRFTDDRTRPAPDDSPPFTLDLLDFLARATSRVQPPRQHQLED